MQDKLVQLQERIARGDFRALARGITFVENEYYGYEFLLTHLNAVKNTKVIGITGPPGAGKSTLVNRLLKHWLAENRKIAVLAVDPSSPFNFGAILGDRIRMSEFYTNPNIFIRSLASRGALGGLSAKIMQITDLVKEAPFDFIVIETVGVGQSEVEIAGLADCTVVVLVPEAGDEVQTLKAGIMEIADIFVVNKADRADAEGLYRNLRMMVHEKASGDKEIPVIKTIATGEEGIEELATNISRFLENDNHRSEFKFQFLSEKCWYLLQKEMMRKVDRVELQQQLYNEASQAGFNLYTFVKDYMRKHNL